MESTYNHRASSPRPSGSSTLVPTATRKILTGPVASLPSGVYVRTGIGGAGNYHRCSAPNATHTSTPRLFLDQQYDVTYPGSHLLRDGATGTGNGCDFALSDEEDVSLMKLAERDDQKWSRRRQGDWARQDVPSEQIITTTWEGAQNGAFDSGTNKHLGAADNIKMKLRNAWQTRNTRQETTREAAETGIAKDRITSVRGGRLWCMCM